MTIFLSYARGDDETFVRRLHRDLLALGFEVWFDRVDLPSRRLTFHQEIKDAIRRSSRLIHVVGPKAAVSDYVREEWQFALATDKAVIPILRAGEYGNVPERLSKLHCEDFRDDSEYELRLSKLVENLKKPPPPLGPLYGVPELPEHFVPRPQVTRAVTDALLADLRGPLVATGSRSRIGLYGMGGIGKSLLAAAVARDPEIRRAYCDGIVWLTLGPEPRLVRVQREIAHALEGGTAFDDPKAGRAALRELLRDKAALLVLDDVWEPAHALHLAELGPRCRALLTTRDAGVLDRLRAESLRIQLLTDAEARWLLSRSAATETALTPEAEQIIRECQGLPLALTLCAGLARGAHGLPWSSILDVLRGAKLEEICDEHALEPEHRTLWRAMKIGVDALPLLQRERWVELAAFRLHGTVPVSAVHALWDHTSDLDRIGRQKLLKRLAERSLIYLDADRPGGESTVNGRVSMHDLLYDYARRVAGNLPALHARFAEAALAIRAEGPAGFSGYLRDRLPEHLVAAEQPGRLVSVLADPGLDYFHIWAEQGMAAEGAACLEYLLQHLAEGSGSTHLIRSLATQLARLNNRLGRNAAAERSLDIALEGYHGERIGGRVEAVALHELATLALSRGDYADAARAYRHALGVVRRLSPAPAGEVAANLIGLALISYLTRDRTSRAIRLAKLALEWAQKAGDVPHMAEAYRLLADAHKDDMRFEEAERYLTAGLRAAERDDLATARLSLLAARAWMLTHRALLGDGSGRDAERAFRDLLVQAERSHDWRFRAEAWCGLGRIGLMNQQAPLIDDAIDQLTAMGGDEHRPHVRARLGLLTAARLYRANAFTEAAGVYAHTAELSRQAGLRSREVGALIGQAFALIRDGRPEEGAECLSRVEEVLPKCPRATQEIVRRILESHRREACPDPFLPQTERL